MNRALLALLLAASVVAVAQEPKAKPADPKAAAEKKADKKAKKEQATAPAAPAKPAAAPAPAPKTAPAPAAAPAAKPAPAKAAPVAGGIVANKDSKIYHRADCKTLGKMKEANKVGFASAAEADKAGYKPCKVCKP